MADVKPTYTTEIKKTLISIPIQDLPNVLISLLNDGFDVYCVNQRVTDKHYNIYSEKTTEEAF